MTVFGREILRRFARKHKYAERPMDEWLQEAERATWQSIEEVRQTQPSADGVRIASGTIVTVFNIGGNKYRLLVLISYAAGAVRVLEVLTHAEYDKEKWKRKW